MPLPAMPPQIPSIAVPQCVVQAAKDYSLPLRGLISVWITEGGTVGMQNKNRNGTVDYGPMQINTVWARRLRDAFGITTQTLTYDFCSSVRAGAYILRVEINAAGGSWWDGVGHYHSRAPHHKYEYIERVYNNSLKF